MGAGVNGGGMGVHKISHKTYYYGNVRFPTLMK